MHFFFYNMFPCLRFWSFTISSFCTMKINNLPNYLTFLHFHPIIYKISNDLESDCFGFPFYQVQVLFPKCILYHLTTGILFQ